MRVLMQERVSVSGEKVARNHASCFWLGVRDSQSYAMTPIARKLEHCCHISPLTWPCLSSSLSPTLLRPQPGHLSNAGDAGQPVLPLLFTQPSGHGPAIASTFVYVCISHSEFRGRAASKSFTIIQDEPCHWSAWYRSSSTWDYPGWSRGLSPALPSPSHSGSHPPNTPSASLPGSAVAVG